MKGTTVLGGKFRPSFSTKRLTEVMGALTCDFRCLFMMTILTAELASFSDRHNI